MFGPPPARHWLPISFSAKYFSCVQGQICQTSTSFPILETNVCFHYLKLGLTKWKNRWADWKRFDDDSFYLYSFLDRISFILKHWFNRTKNSINVILKLSKSVLVLIEVLFNNPTELSLTSNIHRITGIFLGTIVTIERLSTK